MFFNQRFIYDDGAGEGGGAPVTQESFLTLDEAKGLGFDSKEALTEFISKSKEASRPDADKEKEAEIEKTNFLKYSAENNLLKLEDYNQHETLKSKPDRDVIYQKFASDFKEDNPDIEPEELDAEIKNAFENEYKLNSENQKAKARGEARLKKEAAELKSPYEQKYTSAYENYKGYKEAAKNYPEFNKFIDEVITENTPDKFTVKIKDGEEEIPVEVELTKEQRTELEKIFKTPKYFNNYLKGEKKGELKTAIAKKINGFIKANNFDAAVNKSYTVAAGIYTKKGSNIGAENFFSTQKDNQGGAAVIDISKTLAESNEKMHQARRR